MSNEERQNGWDEWRNHVLSELKRQNELIEKIYSKIEGLGEDMSALKVKAGVWGLAGGLIPVLIALGVWFITGQK